MESLLMSHSSGMKTKRLSGKEGECEGEKRNTLQLKRTTDLPLATPHDYHCC